MDDDKRMVESQIQQSNVIPDAGQTIGYCAVCIFEAKLTNVYGQGIVLVDAAQCSSPFHASLLVPPKVCPTCGGKVSNAKGHSSRTKYCSHKCAGTANRAKGKKE